MMMTLSFKEIFPDYETFKLFTDEFSLYQMDDAIAESLNQSIYYNLYNKYLNCNIAYDTEDEFCAEFGIVYQQYFREFLQKKKLIDEIYKLKLDDFLIISESVSNYSNNPNNTTTDPWQVLDYISNQNRGRASMGKLTAYLNALRTMPDAQINYMLNKFDYLWLDIIPTETRYFY